MRLIYDRVFSGPPQSIAELEIRFSRMKVSTEALERNQILHSTAPVVFGSDFTVDRGKAPDYLSSSTHVHAPTLQCVVRLLVKENRHRGILFENVDYHAILKILKQIDTPTLKDLDLLQDISTKVIIAVS